MVPKNTRPLLALAVVGFATVATVATAGEPPLPAGWVSRPIPAAGDGEWACANWSEDEWVVSAAAGRLEISRRDPRKPVATLPFEPLLAPGETKMAMRRPSVVRAAPGGYLVGYDQGEFGGGLYWFSADGRKHSRLPPPAGAKPGRFPQNVHAIAEHEGSFFVFQGLSHLTSRRGRVLRVRPTDEGWLVAGFVSLNATPEVVLEERSGSWLIAATDGVSRVTASGAVEQLWGRPEVLVGLYPGSMARSTDGRVYVGMRAWVLRLVWAPREARWRADFLAPASCMRLVRPPGPLEPSRRCSCAGS